MSVETLCSLAGQHRLGRVVRVLADGRRRKRCRVCRLPFDVEPDTTAIYAYPSIPDPPEAA